MQPRQLRPEWRPFDDQKIARIRCAIQPQIDRITEVVEIRGDVHLVRLKHSAVSAKGDGMIGVKIHIDEPEPIDLFVKFPYINGCDGFYVRDQTRYEELTRAGFLLLPGSAAGESEVNAITLRSLVLSLPVPAMHVIATHQITGIFAFTQEALLMPDLTAGGGILYEAADFDFSRYSDVSKEYQGYIERLARLHELGALAVRRHLTPGDTRLGIRKTFSVLMQDGQPILLVTDLDHIRLNHEVESPIVDAHRIAETYVLRQCIDRTSARFGKIE